MLIEKEKENTVTGTQKNDHKIRYETWTELHNYSEMRGRVNLHKHLEFILQMQ